MVDQAVGTWQHKEVWEECRAGLGRTHSGLEKTPSVLAEKGADEGHSRGSVHMEGMRALPYQGSVLGQRKHSQDHKGVSSSTSTRRG